MRRITLEDRKKIETWLKQTLPLSEIERRLALSMGSLRYELLNKRDEDGVYQAEVAQEISDRIERERVVMRSQRRPKIDKATGEEVVKLHRMGHTTQQIVEILNIPTYMVLYRIRKERHRAKSIRIHPETSAPVAPFIQSAHKEASFEEFATKKIEVLEIQVKLILEILKERLS